MTSIILNDEILIKVGPRGEPLGRNVEEWDESSYGDVKQIFVTHGDAINSIQMLYEHQGTSTVARRHGEDAEKFDCITLEPEEYLTSISGHYGTIEPPGSMVVRSIKFQSSRRRYGPYGGGVGTPFRFTFENGAKFGGFHGRSNRTHLCAIGVYLKSGAKHYIKPAPAMLDDLPPKQTNEINSSMES